MKVRATREPGSVSVRDVAKVADEDFVDLLAEQQCGTAADYAAFMTGLLQSPAWQQLWAEAMAEAERLTALLQPELRPGAVVVAEEEEEDAKEWGVGGSVS